MLTVSRLRKSFLDSGSRVDVLRNVNLALPAGNSCALLGESGSGKSTLLHLIAGLDAPDSGEILLNGESVSQLSETRRLALRRESIGLVFQHFHLIGTLSVLDNIQFVASLSGGPATERAVALAERLGIAHLLTRFPDQLSGGQQQRVAIARALLPKPLLVLADEPTGSLDEDNSELVMNLLKSLCREQQVALLLATHSTTVAQGLDQQVVLRQGSVHG